LKKISLLITALLLVSVTKTFSSELKDTIAYNLFFVDTAKQYQSRMEVHVYQAKRDSVLLSYWSHKNKRSRPTRDEQFQYDSLNTEYLSRISYLLYKVVVKGPKDMGSLQNLDLIISMDGGALITVNKLKELYLTYPASLRNTALGKRVQKEVYHDIHVGESIPPCNDELEADGSGARIKLKDLFNTQYKYTLICFGASWCGPCRYEGIALKRNAGRINRSIINIVGVSMDTKKQSWVTALAQDKLPWKNYLMVQNFNSCIASKLDITGVPRTLVIDNKNSRILFEENSGYTTGKLLAFLSSLR
jgi:thiol-disulfide isomerase/thioredoxin